MGFTKPTLSLSGMFGRIAADAAGATAAAMAATQESAAECFAKEQDPAGKAWAPLAASTLKGRKPGPILLDLGDSLRWPLLGPGRWAVRSTKAHAGYQLGPDPRTGRPGRPYLPVDADSRRAVSERVRASLLGWLRSHRESA